MENEQEQQQQRQQPPSAAFSSSAGEQERGEEQKKDEFQSLWFESPVKEESLLPIGEDVKWLCASWVSDVTTALREKSLLSKAAITSTIFVLLPFAFLLVFPPRLSETPSQKPKMDRDQTSTGDGDGDDDNDDDDGRSSDPAWLSSSQRRRQRTPRQRQRRYDANEAESDGFLDKLQSRTSSSEDASTQRSPLQSNSLFAMISSSIESIWAKPEARAEAAQERGEPGVVVAAQTRDNSSTLTRMRTVAAETKKEGADFNNQEEEQQQPISSDETNASLVAQGDQSDSEAHDEQGVIWKRRKQAQSSYGNDTSATPRRKIRDTLMMKKRKDNEKPS